MKDSLVESSGHSMVRQTVFFICCKNHTVMICVAAMNSWIFVINHPSATEIELFHPYSVRNKTVQTGGLSDSICCFPCATYFSLCFELSLPWRYFWGLGPAADAEFEKSADHPEFSTMLKVFHLVIPRAEKTAGFLITKTLLTTTKKLEVRWAACFPRPKNDPRSRFHGKQSCCNFCPNLGGFFRPKKIRCNVTWKWLYQTAS